MITPFGLGVDISDGVDVAIARWNNAFKSIGWTDGISVSLALVDVESNVELKSASVGKLGVRLCTPLRRLRGDGVLCAVK